MANKRISDLDAVSAVTGTDQFALDNALNVTKKGTGSQILSYIQSATSFSDLNNTPALITNYAVFSANSDHTSLIESGIVTSGSGDINLPAAGGFQINGVNINVGATLSNVSYLNQGNVFSQIQGYDFAPSFTPASNQIPNIKYVDDKFAGTNEFSELTDVSGAYTTANALYKTNATIDGLDETSTTLSESVANQFVLTRGTTSFSVSSGSLGLSGLTNDRVMVSSSNAIIESATITTAELALLNGMVSVSKGIADNDKLASQGYVDDSVGADQFDQLTDVTGAYTTGFALYRVNGTTTGLEETTTKLTEPTLNEFTLTKGTTDLAVEASSVINQNLATYSSTTKFAELELTTELNLTNSTLPVIYFNDQYRMIKFESSGVAMSMQSPGGVVLNIDNNNNGTSEKFSIRKDTTNVCSGGTEIFRVREDGQNFLDGLFTLQGTASPSISGRLTLNYIGNTTGIGAVNSTWSIDSYPANDLRVFSCNSSGSYTTGFQISETGGIYFPQLVTISGNSDVQYSTSSKQLGYVSSALRYKTNITDMEDTNWIYDLRTVNFESKDELGAKKYGLIAEEVEIINPTICGYSFITETFLDSNECEQVRNTEEKQIETVSYTTLITPILHELQILKARVDALTA